MLDKAYTSAAIEKKYYALWEESGAFKAGHKKGGKPYTIMMPPANVTGTLHLGHALTFTLQDILVRYHRMQGYDVLWQPGTDHAGIATQMVVERQLAEQKTDRHALGREKFIEKVWEWKEISGGTIINQLKMLGSSADWSRERFTMDPHFNDAVIKVFVQLYNEGLIYRDQRLVNWDVKFQTAISDLEVEQRDEKGKMWHLRYPLADGTGHIIVATTRPETFFGDTAVAVHPDDERYQHLIGKEIILPLIHRRIPIVADTYCDPTKGTGAVKITPAHDFNDFAVGERHHLPRINIMDAFGKLNTLVPSDYQGLDMATARKKVVEYFVSQELLEKEEDITHSVPYGDRSGVVIEPYLTDQWFVDAKTMAQPAIKAVEKGDTSFVPENWSATYFEWMRNIQPWCISRQIWWGHQVPAWYGPDGTFFVAETAQEAAEKAAAHYGKDVELKQDTDVLDTWFSSALWPFVTLGWPDQTKALETYYPTSVLVTGFDIIFFWVARMMMMGMHFQKEIPFQEVYIHALVRDAKGQKMSKSKGNVIDPVALIENYGADAVRFTLAHLAAPGRDIKLSEERVVMGRNFTTKLWNATRYLMMNECRYTTDFTPNACQHPVNRWVVSMLSDLQKDLDTAFQHYRFNDVAGKLYHFAWDVFCDWYIEFTKPLLMGSDEALKQETRNTLGWSLGQLCHLLHPVKPFLTEELWHAIGGKGLLIEATWPQIHFADADAQKDLNWVVQVITDLRALRAEMNIPAGAKLKIMLKESTPAVTKRLGAYEEILCRIGRLESIAIATDHPTQDMLQLIVDGGLILISLEGVVDRAKEKDRLEKEMAKVDAELKAVAAKLDNPQIMAKAPGHIIEEYQERQKMFLERRDALDKALRVLG